LYDGVAIMLHPDVITNVSKLDLMMAFEMRAFLVHNKQQEEPLMAELITALEKHIQKVGNV